MTKTTNGGGPVVVMESFYDAFGRRRAKRNALSDGQEFLYDLGHQVLVDSMWKDTASSVTADEYVWLDGRPVLVVRSNLKAKGAHSIDSVDELDTGAGNCSRPIDEGQVNCGLFHLVSNLQGFVNVAIHDGTGLVASVMLPDADGTVNQPRMMAAGTNGTAWTQRFNVPASYSKQARFRTSWTGGLPGWGNGVDAFKLAGQTVLTGGPTTELGQVWSSWGPTVTGTTDVVWSTTCSGGCMSAADQFEWRAWETGAARFQTRLRFPGQYADAETDFYENWNRYYDPPTGRYWSPEPLLRNPLRLLGSHVWRGLGVAAYGYTYGNPVAWSDRDGLDVTNNTKRSVWVKPENGTAPVEVPPGGTYKGAQDGLTHPDRPGQVFKTVNGQDAKCEPGGGVSTAPSPQLGRIDRAVSSAGQAVKGGWKGPEFKKTHPDWNELFDKSVGPAVPSPTAGGKP